MGALAVPALGTKRPARELATGWHEQSSRDPAQIAMWLSGRSHGVALHCGRSSAVVSDVDGGDAA